MILLIAIRNSNDGASDILRSSRSQMFFKIHFSKLRKLYQKTPVLEPFFNKVKKETEVSEI